MKICSVYDCDRDVVARGWCMKHYDSWRNHGDPLWKQTFPSTEERFWPKVNKNGPAPEYNPKLGPCWIWCAHLSSRGYGRFNFNGKTNQAHRYSYELLIGNIPEGLELDHLCRVRRCVNPDHLEPVTHEENVRRGQANQWRKEKVHCPQGHEYAGENLYINSSGGRACWECRINARTLQKERKKKTEFLT